MAKGGKVVCSSTHLSNFAVLAGYSEDRESPTSTALVTISFMGCSISIICLLLLIIYYLVVRRQQQQQQNEQDQVALLNLSISLILLNTLLLIGIDRTSHSLTCSLVAAFLHYLLLVSFAWMLVEALLQYLRFVKVFDTHVSRFKTLSIIPSWGLPALVVIVTACIDHTQFRGPEHYCWLAEDAFRYAFLTPLAVILCINVIFFVLIIRSITCSRPDGMQTNQSRSRLMWLQFHVMVCCFVVMGLTWSFALFAVGKAALVMQFLFAIFNSLQGFFIFLLFNLRDEKARAVWVSLLKKVFPCCVRQKAKNEFYVNFTSSYARVTNRSDEEMLNTNDTKSSGLK